MTIQERDSTEVEAHQRLHKTRSSSVQAINRLQGPRCVHIGDLGPPRAAGRQDAAARSADSGHATTQRFRIHPRPGPAPGSHGTRIYRPGLMT